MNREYTNYASKLAKILELSSKVDPTFFATLSEYLLTVSDCELRHPSENPTLSYVYHNIIHDLNIDLI